MIWWTLLGIALGLAMDALAVAIATGLTLGAGHSAARLPAGVPLRAVPVHDADHRLAGRPRVGRATSGGYDHWVAFVLLSLRRRQDALGVVSRRPENRAAGSAIRPAACMLVTLSVATSLDALAVGVSMALIGISVWVPSVVIGLVAGVLTAVGIVFGSRLGSRWEHWAELAGGLVLLAIGVKILWSHLAGPASSVVLWMVQ